MAERTQSGETREVYSDRDSSSEKLLITMAFMNDPRAATVSGMRYSLWPETIITAMRGTNTIMYCGVLESRTAKTRAIVVYSTNRRSTSSLVLNIRTPVTIMPATITNICT